MMSPRARIRDFLDLVRLPNLFTAAADIGAGFFFAGGSMADWKTALHLCAASMCLYAGGVALNDVCDAERDAVLRRELPIPSGRISRSAACRWSVILLACGVLLAFFVSWRCGLLAVGIVTAVILYDDVLKQTRLAPAFMGLCRALNLALGMHPATTIFSAANLTLLALMWLYVASVTLFARRESQADRPRQLGAGACGILVACLLLGFFADSLPAAHREAVWPAWILAIVLGGAGIHTSFHPSPRRVQVVVKFYVVCLVLLDACIAWIGAGPQAAMLVASLVVPTLALAALFRVT